MSFQQISDNNTKHQWTGYPQDFLKFIYDEVIVNNAKNILEFGTGFGYVTSTLAMGVRDVSENGVVNTYDSYKPNNIWQVSDNNVDRVGGHLHKYDLLPFVKFYQVDDISDWFNAPHDFDMCFVDIDNDGDKLNNVFNQPVMKEAVERGVNIYFCGGSKLRDEINLKRNEKPITEVDCKIECVYGHTEKICISKFLGY